MDQSARNTEAVRRLRDVKNRASTILALSEMTEAKRDVIRTYQELFAAPRLGELAEDEFRSFLLFDHNRHWKGIHRQGARICSDMERLRRALYLIVTADDETVASNLDEAIQSVKGMGKAIATAVLHVTHSDRYGVWNRVSEDALRALGLWPTFAHGLPFGRKYEQVNAILTDLAQQLDVDLWTLDALLWQVAAEEAMEPPTSGDAPVPPILDAARFGLERHLHEFLLDNWERTELGNEWKIHEDDEDPEAGSEFRCPVGKIDILAQHRTEPHRWLVIELKLGQTDDVTVGQILRYMGWVRRDFASPDGRVEGRIIARESTDRLFYALAVVPDVELLLYEVDFRLVDPNGAGNAHPES